MLIGKSVTSEVLTVLFKVLIVGFCLSNIPAAKHGSKQALVWVQVEISPEAKRGGNFVQTFI